MPTFAVLRHASILLGILLLIALPAQAEPPPAPTELTVEFTRYGFPNNIEGISTNNAWHSWYLTWKDNALDEDGYHVQVRFGNAGPFFTANQLPPDSTFVRISTGIPDPTGNTPLPIRGVGTPIQFRIIPWKFNGTVTESSSAIITSVIPPPDSRSELAAPSNLTTSVVDADPNTPGVQPDDGKVRLSWTDNSSGELYQRLRMRENGAQSGAETGWLTIVPARFLGVEVPFNRTTVTLSNQDFILTNDATPRLVRLQLIPGKTYEFEVGAGNSYGSNGGLSIPGNYLVRTTSTTHFTVPQLAAPSFFSATPQGEAAMLLSWRDNSNNETGFEVQYRRITAEADPPWLTLGTVGENVTQVTLPIIQTANAEIRVRAIHAYRPSGASSDTVLYSAFSNPATSSTDAFRAPSALTATTSGVARSIDLTWQDNSSSEYGFNIYCRPAGTTGAYLFCRATPANVTQVRVDSYTNDSPFTSNTLNFTPFVVGNAYEFVVRAVGNDEDIESLNSASATAFARDGF
ncbi:MAG: fibronectin type III domain-containing protein, partial [Prosthecobacter sp.]|nr:fibronectin type III domain-containing protein [Prosthecobacter sp.]